VYLCVHISGCLSALVTHKVTAGLYLATIPYTTLLLVMWILEKLGQRVPEGKREGIL